MKWIIINAFYINLLQYIDFKKGIIKKEDIKKKFDEIYE